MTLNIDLNRQKILQRTEASIDIRVKIIINQRL
jgi:hypothetical protein